MSVFCEGGQGCVHGTLVGGGESVCRERKGIMQSKSSGFEIAQHKMEAKASSLLSACWVMLGHALTSVMLLLLMLLLLLLLLLLFLAMEIDKHKMEAKADGS